MSSRIVKSVSYLVLFTILISSLLQPAAAQTKEYGVTEKDIQAPEPTSLTVEPLKNLEHGVATLHVELADHLLQVGDTTDMTVHVSNATKKTVTNVHVALPLPAGTSAVSTDDYTAENTSWNWSIKELAAGETQTWTVTVKVESLPVDQALQAQATLQADGHTDAQANTGAVVFESTVARPQPARFAPGKPLTVAHAQAQARVELPANASKNALNISIRSALQATAKEHAAIPMDTIGFKRGFGPFFLDATDSKGTAVHTFDAPLTIQVSYTEAQLQALNIAEADLTIFWFNEATGLWEPQITTVDREKNVAMIEVNHFSSYQLGDGSSPSEAFIPSLQGWQVGMYTGGANFSYPIDVPAGAGGMKPNLGLSYSSNAPDGAAGQRQKQQAGWVGNGWSLDTGAISRHKINAGNTTISYYSLVMNGQSYNLVGTLKNGYTNAADEDPTHWDWRSTDESFIRVVVEENGDSTSTRGGYKYVNGVPVPYKRHIWKVWTKDGTLYEFEEDAWWGFNQCIGAWAGDYTYMEAYSWKLSRVVDVHSNEVNYAYGRDSVYIPYSVTENCMDRVVGIIDRDVWPTEITWGGNSATGAIDRYRVEFVSGARIMDLAFEGAGNQLGGMNQGSPRETKQLNAIRVWSKPASAWEQVREYRFEYEPTAPTYSDFINNTTNPVTPDMTHPRLTLKSIQRVGNNGTTALPKTSFTYGGWALTPGTNYPVGSWNRLTHVDNGQGGTLSFTYENIGYAINNSSYINNRRVVAKTTNDGRGNTSTFTYSYNNPSYNTLHGALMPGGIGPAYPNSAALYHNKQYNPTYDYSNWLLHRPFTEFRGHSDVTETLPTGAKIKHHFYQGNVNCAPTATGNAIYTDACFISLRDREFLKGREYHTQTFNANNALISENFTNFTVEFKSYGSSPLSGLWRAWSYENSQMTKTWEGMLSSPKTYEKLFTYNSTFQFNKVAADGYGNLTHIEEKINGTKFRITEYGYETRDVTTDTTNANAYIVDRKRFENIRDGSDRLLSHKVFMYDGMTTQHGIGSKGLLTMARSYVNVPLMTTVSNMTLQSQDTSFGYDAYGNQTTITTYTQPGTKAIYSTVTYSAPGNGSTARTTTITYDSTFHVFSEQTTLPNSLTESAGYDKRMGTMTSVTGPNGIATRVSAEYDVFGRMVKLIKPGDTSAIPTIEALYYDAEQPFRYVVYTREQSGVSGAVHVATQFYNGLGQKIQTKSETLNGTQNVVVDYQYDGMGQLWKESQPRYVNQSSSAFWNYTTVPGTGVLWTTHSYDALGRKLSVTTPNNETTSMSYSLGSVGTATSTIDPRGNKKVHEYDMTGRLIKVEEFQGTSTSYATTTYQYNELDLLKKVIDAQSNQTTMSYDSLGRKTAMTDPDMGSWSYTYDINGNLTHQVDAKNQTLTFGYDTLDRLVSKSFNNGFSGTTNVSYTYDQIDSPNHTYGKGQRTSMTDASGTHHWAYNTRGEVSRESKTVTGASTYISSYTYRADGQLATETYPTGEVLTYNYDPARRQTSMSSSLGDTYVTNTTYDALNQPLTRSLGNATTENYTYESLSGRLQTMRVNTYNGKLALQRDYTYHTGGNVKTIKSTNAVEEAATIAYGYDHLDRLTLACAWNWSTNACLSGNFYEAYSYDTLGNILSKAGTTYTYGSSKPHAVTQAGTNSYSYDNNGNMTTGAGRTFTWNGENQPVQIAKVGTPTETYAYDGDNVRIKKAVWGTTIDVSVYVGKVEYRGNQVISTYGGVASRTTTGNPTSTNKGTLVYMHSDHLGSVSMTTSETGSIAQTQEFDPWGAVKSGGITSVSYNYTGQRLDGTGLLFYNARYYDPQLARFTSADSIVPADVIPDEEADVSKYSVSGLTVDMHEVSLVVHQNQLVRSILDTSFKDSLKLTKKVLDPQQLNRYSYVNNNPVIYNDPSGHGKGTGYVAYCRDSNGTSVPCGQNGTGIGDEVIFSDGSALMLIWYTNDRGITSYMTVKSNDYQFQEFKRAVDSAAPGYGYAAGGIAIVAGFAAGAICAASIWCLVAAGLGVVGGGVGIWGTANSDRTHSNNARKYYRAIERRYSNRTTVSSSRNRSRSSAGSTSTRTRVASSRSARAI